MSKHKIFMLILWVCLIIFATIFAIGIIYHPESGAFLMALGAFTATAGYLVAFSIVNHTYKNQGKGE